ncbi:MAG: MoaD/ThiS family protein [Thermoplasmata archaeon]
MVGTARVLLFATAREAVGTPQLEWPVPDEGLAISELVAALIQRYPRLGPVSAHSRFLINSECVRGVRAKVRPGDELAIHPPYSGG